MDKVIRDGKVAVLYSPGYGAGWSTWNDECANILFEPRIVNLVLAGAGVSKIEAAAEEIWPGKYFGGARDLQVEWLDQGTRFRVDEYDGNEHIETEESIEWAVA